MSSPRDRNWRLLTASIAILLLGVVLLYFSAEFPDRKWTSIIQSTGVSLVTAAIISVLYDTFIYQILLCRIEHAVEVSLALKDEVLKSGFLSTKNQMPWDKIIESSRNTDIGNIAILQNHSPQLMNILDGARKMIAKGKQVDLYLQHPDSIFARARSVDLGQDDTWVSVNVIRNISEIRRFFRLSNETEGRAPKIRLWLYDSMPPFCVYANGPFAWIGFFWKGSRADIMPVVQVACDIRYSIWKGVADNLERIRRDDRTVEVDMQSCELPPLPTRCDK